MNTKARSTIIFFLTIIVIAALAYFGAYGAVIGNYQIKSFGQTISRGLDLQGGVSVVEEIVEDNTADTSKLQEKMDRTIQLLSERVNKLGVSETSVTQEGKNRIRIDVPGKYDTKEVVESVAKTGKLTFKDPDGNVILTGDDVKDAKAAVDQNGKYIISLEMNDTGTKKFADATQKFLGKQIAIYLDEEMLTNPTVETVITEGKAQITGNRSLEEAKRIANMIKSGALPVTLKTAAAKTVGATLGANALPKSIFAGFVGICLVFAFMLILYRVPGLMANIALVLYTVLVLLIFSIIKATLTLSGIAAFLLTIGMAVDANVLMFERMKEELRNGKSIKTSLNTGFHKALSSILDSNITTAIAGIVLYSFGSGTVKGFALTLLVGIIVSLFTAIVVTRFLLKLLADMGLLNNLALFGVKRR